VVESWSGAYLGDIKTQVERFFDVPLPGLIEPPAAAAG
jgi:hypothetical protein